MFRGCASLAASLVGVVTLHTIDMSSNRIGVPGALALGEFLRGPSCHLRVLNVRDNKLGDRAMAGLGSGIAACTSMESVNIAENKLTK